MTFKKDASLEQAWVRLRRNRYLGLIPLAVVFVVGLAVVLGMWAYGGGEAMSIIGLVVGLVFALLLVAGVVVPLVRASIAGKRQYTFAGHKKIQQNPTLWQQATAEFPARQLLYPSVALTQSFLLLINASGQLCILPRAAIKNVQPGAQGHLVNMWDGEQYITQNLPAYGDEMHPADVIYHAAVQGWQAPTAPDGGVPLPPSGEAPTGLNKVVGSLAVPLLLLAGIVFVFFSSASVLVRRLVSFGLIIPLVNVWWYGRRRSKKQTIVLGVAWALVVVVAIAYGLVGLPPQPPALQLAGIDVMPGKTTVGDLLDGGFELYERGPDTPDYKISLSGMEADERTHHFIGQEATYEQHVLQHYTKVDPNTQQELPANFLCITIHGRATFVLAKDGFVYGVLELERPPHPLALRAARVVGYFYSWRYGGSTLAAQTQLPGPLLEGKPVATLSPGWLSAQYRQEMHFIETPEGEQAYSPVPPLDVYPHYRIELNFDADTGELEEMYLRCFL